MAKKIQSTSKELKQLQDRIRNDPVYFARAILGDEPWEKQKEILLSVRDNKYTAVRSGHGVGKTYIAARTGLWFLFSFYESIVLTTAPTWRQVKMLLWKEVHRACAGAKIEMGGKLLDTELHAPAHAGWYMMGLSTDEPHKFQGFHAEHLLVIIDEASGVDRKIYDACQSVMTSANCKMLAIGNPLEPSGWFFEAFQSPAWHKIHISSYDCPNITEGKIIYPKLVTREWIDERIEEWGKDTPMFASRVLGEFPQAGTNALVPLSWMEYETDRCQLVPPVMGVDVARFGDDETVLCIRRGNIILDMQAYRKIDTMETCGKVISAMRRFGIKAQDVKVDDTGVGGGVTDRLREQGHHVKAVNFGEKAQDSKAYHNLRAEIFWALRKALSPESDNRLSIPKIAGKVKAQLSALKYKHDSQGRIQIEAKDDYKKRVGRSPDWADALAISYAKPHIQEEIFVVG